MSTTSMQPQISDNDDDSRAAAATSSPNVSPDTSMILVPCKPSKYATSGVITLFVGTKRKNFEIHKHALIAQSTYFKAALKNGWDEDQTNEIYWEDEDLAVVETMIVWLYGKKIVVHERRNTTSHLVKCYALGHRRGMPGFQNHVMDKIRELAGKKCFESDLLRKIYSFHLEKTPIYDFAVRSAVWSMMAYPSAWRSRKNGVAVLFQGIENAQLYNSILVGLLEFREEDWECPLVLHGCHFHIHPQGRECKGW